MDEKCVPCSGQKTKKKDFTLRYMRRWYKNIKMSLNKENISMWK